MFKYLLLQFRSLIFMLWNTLTRFAAAPRELRTDWAKFTKDYFLNRSTLVGVFLLIDASIPAKPIDLEYASWLGQNQVNSHTYMGQTTRAMHVHIFHHWFGNNVKRHNPWSIRFRWHWSSPNVIKGRRKRMVGKDLKKMWMISRSWYEVSSRQHRHG